MEALLTFLGAFGFTEILALTVVVFALALIYKKATDGEVYSEIFDIKEKMRSRLWGFIRNELRLVEAVSLENTRRVIETLDVGDYCSHDTMMALYKASLERSLYIFLFEDIKTSMRENGFHNLKGAELDQYIEDKAESLLAYSRMLVVERCPFLTGTDENRYSLDMSIKFYSKVVRKSIDLKNEQDKEIKALKSNNSLIVVLKKLFPKKS